MSSGDSHAKLFITLPFWMHYTGLADMLFFEGFAKGQ